jgi:hypothetical protein
VGLTTSDPLDIGNVGSGLYMRDPSDGGTGTEVVTSGLSASNAEDWVVYQDINRCIGIVVDWLRSVTD